LENSLKIIGRDPKKMKITAISKAENSVGDIISTVCDIIAWLVFLFENKF
jgi:hypothetical protein